jgi:hypothetical protein
MKNNAEGLKILWGYGPLAGKPHGRHQEAFE